MKDNKIFDFSRKGFQDIINIMTKKINECVDMSNGMIGRLDDYISKVDWNKIVNSDLYQSVLNDLNKTSEELDNKANEEEVLKKWSVSPVSVFTQFNHDYVYGLENLYHLHMKVGRHEECKVIFSGDSTTAGYGLAEPTFYTPSNIFKYTCLKEGLFCVKTVNKGQSGVCTEHWNRTFVQDEIIENPDCIVLRWGINDPSYDNNLILLPEDGGNYDIRRNANDFKISLESGLQKK